jgi:hypothetical protein
MAKFNIDTCRGGERRLGVGTTAAPPAFSSLYLSAL